ncbi:glycosyltransferase, partial [Streptococcus gordonii]|nr:glycosyltransferase [Streptococcus gordonii]
RKIVFNSAPKFSIIVPLYNTPISFFNDMAESVKNQSYANWELILVNASPDNQELKARVEQETAHDNRIKSINLTENKGIS